MCQPERVPLKLKADPIVKFNYLEATKLTSANSDRGVAVDIEKAENRYWCPLPYAMHLYQENFCLRQSLMNLHKLTDHFIAVFREVFSKVGEKDFLPKVADFRCHMLSYHLMMWGLHAIFAPDKIKLDLLMLL